MTIRLKSKRIGIRVVIALKATVVVQSSLFNRMPRRQNRTKLHSNQTKAQNMPTKTL